MISLSHLKQLADSATSGPWEHSNCDLNRVNNSRTGNCIAATWSEGEEGIPGIHYTNAKFIAAAREAVPLLVDEVLRLREVILSYSCAHCNGLPNCLVCYEYGTCKALAASKERLPE
jgi:hypothetical protein